MLAFMQIRNLHRWKSVTFNGCIFFFFLKKTKLYHHLLWNCRNECTNLWHPHTRDILFLHMNPHNCKWKWAFSPTIVCARHLPNTHHRMWTTALQNRYLDPNFTDEETIRTSGAGRKRKGHDQEIKGRGGFICIGKADLTWVVGSWVCYSFFITGIGLKCFMINHLWRFREVK